MTYEEILYRVIHVVAQVASRDPWTVDPTYVLGNPPLNIGTTLIPRLRAQLEANIQQQIPTFKLPPGDIDSSLTVMQTADAIDGIVNGKPAKGAALTAAAWHPMFANAIAKGQKASSKRKKN